MAEIAVTAVITVLCEKIISADLMKLARSEGIDSKLNKWKRTLPLIQAVLVDASQKHTSDKAVQLWVNDLQDLAYDIEDVLDDLATEAMRRKLNQKDEASTSTSKVLKIILTCSNFTPRNIMYGQKMNTKLDEITTKLRDLVDQRKDLGLNVNFDRSNMTERRLEQTSLVDESKIMGREGDKVALLGKLLGNEKWDGNVSVVSIVGMGGIGKTTLAKVLYNEEKVKDQFDLMAWVCVSEEFDLFDISMTIFEAVGGENKRFSSLDLLHVALKQKLSNKRFLIVLDDVWNEDHSKWELLQSPLLVGARGSRVIVTARSTTVASAMDSEEVYSLEVLSSEDALSLFAQQVLGEKNFHKHPTLKLLGEGIVKKCGRLPLALKALGRLLKGNRNSDEWEKLMMSEVWNIKDARGVLPALKLSYHHLPPHLKLLFAYCSLFPKDYVFDKNNLVLLWMAEGFLSQSKSMESLGHQYFEELHARSFFQLSTNGKLGYTMHDLISDLATSVAGEFFCRLDGEMDVSDTNENFEKILHISFTGLLRCGSYTTLRELPRASRLRTFLPFSGHWLDNFQVELLRKLQFLRVLRLTRIKEVPQFIGSLKHLRYLDFSYTEITCLPERVSDLYNLQSLLVNNCHKLSSFPRSFAKLINLRHLDISWTLSLKKMPLGIARLTSLQTLSKVMIEEANGFKISDLKNLNDLQGQLSITGLEKVTNPMQAKDANLHRKKALDILEMIWSNEFDDSRDETIEYEVLKELRPSSKLKNLKILNNRGMLFPSWVGDHSFDLLTKLTLSGCRSTHLTLGHLCSLKKLVVERMKEMKTVDFELLSPTNSFVGIAFPSLEVVEFNDMQVWQKWSINNGDNHGTWFPCLHTISIKRCPELAQVSIGLIPSLVVLHLKKCAKTVLRSMVGLSSSLVELKISNVKGLTQLHGEDLMHLEAVELLEIKECEELRYLWERESEACKSLVSLQELQVWSCKKLVSIAEKEDSFGMSMESLKKVVFGHCESLEINNCPSTVERLEIRFCDSLTSLTLLSVSCLTSLEISFCKNLMSFPDEHLQTLTSLEELSIEHCPSLDYSFPCGLWPPKLRKLKVGGLNKPLSEWGPQNFPTSLIELRLIGKKSGVVSFAMADDVRNTTTTTTPSSTFLLPPTLVYLSLMGFKEVESFSEVLQHLPHLKTLNIWYCPKIGDLKTVSKPSNLTINVWKY